MATGMQICKAILQEILVRESEADYEADEYQDTLFALNNFISELELDNLDISWTDLTSLSDTLTSAAGYNQAIIKCMAYIMAPQFGVAITPELKQNYDYGMRVLLRNGKTVLSSGVDYPSTLPKGSGNYDGYGDDDIYYPVPD